MLQLIEPVIKKICKHLYAYFFLSIQSLCFSDSDVKNFSRIINISLPTTRFLSENPEGLALIEE